MLFRSNTGRDRLISAGLAGATCLGVVGVVGVRTVEANAAQAATIDLQVATTPDTADTSAATTSGGLTQGDLDAYAAQLAAEKNALDAYRSKLVKAARQLSKAAAQGNAPASTQSVASVPTAAKPSVHTARKPAPKAAAAPKAAPAPKAAKPAPQSNTKGS